MSQKIQIGVVSWSRNERIMMNSKILIVEDETKLREVLCDCFASKGEVLIEADYGIQALY